MLMNNNTKITKCKNCGGDIFFLENENGWNTFNADVSLIKRANVVFVDGFDNIKISEPGDIGKTGFTKHFCYGK